MALALAALGFPIAGCTTVTSVQTASTVEKGSYRVGAQASVSPYCGLGFPPRPAICASFPSAIPLPEVRVLGRYGLTDVVDVGLSAQGSVVVPVGAQVGMTVDGKVEVWRRPAGEGRAHVLSVGPSVGYINVQHGLFGELQRGSESTVELALPVYYGYQTENVEWVVSPRFIERISLVDLDRDGQREILDYAAYGLSAGVVSRPFGQVRLAGALEYAAPFQFPAQGNFTVSAGLLIELGGRTTSPASPEAPGLDPG